MRYHSTLDPKKSYDFLTAMQSGLASDGGLYVPEYFPKINSKEFSLSSSYAEFANQLLQPFIHSNEPDHVDLQTICEQAFNFKVPVTALNANTWMLELFHGPTLSFKDFGARFLARCMQHAAKSKPVTILVATSGDTGSAVAAAFYQQYPIKVVVLFPEGKISLRQQQQITCWQDNVTAVAVKGNFDDCQHLVKSAFASVKESSQLLLSTANSINIARLLPQMVYYAYTSLHFQNQHGEAPGFVVPSGNLGNVTAAYWAKVLGFPIREIAIATNDNLAVSHYLKSGNYQAFPTKMTLANAMDVGNPSNFARLKALFPEFDQFKIEVNALAVSDEKIKAAILQAYQQDQKMICPHTATAYYYRQQLSPDPWIIVATAHPCKFEQVIEPIIQTTVPPTSELNALLIRPHEHKTIYADLNELKKILLDDRY